MRKLCVSIRTSNFSFEWNEIKNESCDSFIIFTHSLNNFIICFDDFVNEYYVITYIHITGCGEDLLEWLLRNKSMNCSIISNRKSYIEKLIAVSSDTFMYLCVHLEMKKLFIEIERIFIIFREKMLDSKLNQVIRIFLLPRITKYYSWIFNLFYEFSIFIWHSMWIISLFNLNFA